MNKRIALIVGSILAVIVAIVAAVPYWFGVKAEEALEQKLEALAQRNGFDIVRNDYQRGWLTSKAEIVLHATSVDLTTQHTVQHGPFAFNRWLDGDFNTDAIQARIETRGTLKISLPNTKASEFVFFMATIIALDGSGQSHLESPALKQQVANGSTVEWQGLKGDIVFDAGMRHIRSDILAPRFAFGVGEISDIRFHSDVRQGIANHYLGKNTFEIKEAKIEPGFQLKKLRVAVDTSAQGENLTIGFGYDVDEIQITGGKYGPGKLALEIRKLDAATLARFQEEIGALQRSGRPAEQLGLMQVGKMLQMIGDLAKKAPELEITEMRFRIGDDEIRGKAKVVLDGSKVNIAANPLLILTNLTADAEISLPPSLLKPLLLPLLEADLENARKRGALKKEDAERLSAERLSEILDKTFSVYVARHELTRHLVRQGDHYQLIASLRRGQFLINGEPMNVPATGLLPPLAR